MCKYCEKYKHNKLDSNEYVDDFYTNKAGDSAHIVEPTPNSLRKHKDDKLVAEIVLDCVGDANMSIPGIRFHMPIRYCPMCGKDLNKND